MKDYTKYLIRLPRWWRESSRVAFLILLAGFVVGVPVDQARASPPIEADKTTFAGMNDVNYLWMPDETIAARMWSIQNAGSKWVRVTFYWENIESVKGQRNWSRIDQIVAEARKKGLKILPVLYGFPSWTYRRPNYINDPINCLRDAEFSAVKCQNYSNGSYNYRHYHFITPNPQDFADFAAAAAARYASDIRYWEVWNEPNHCINGQDAPLEWDGLCWAPPNPDEYGKLMRAAYSAMRRAAPDSRIVLGGLSYGDLDYLHRYYQVTAGYQTFDVLALHPYTSGSPGTTTAPDPLGGCASAWPGWPRYNNDFSFCRWSGIHAMRNEMLWAGDGNKPIWLTEFGWRAGDDTTSQENQKLWMRQALQRVGREMGYVEKVFYFAWSDHPGYAAPDCPSVNYGLIGVDRFCSQYLKPAVNVYADWGREAQKVTITTPAFNQVLNPYGWYRFAGAFNDAAYYTTAQVRLIIDGNEIASYDVGFEGSIPNRNWFFWIQPWPWILAFGTQGLPEHTVALKVVYGGSLETFYTSQVFRVSQP